MPYAPKYNTAIPNTHRPAAAAPAFGISIASKNTGNMFTINTAAVSQAEAQQQCNNIGAHLAAYASLEEQAEVETQLAAAGYLLPAYHKSYWIGLRSAVLYNPDAFKWIDKSVAGNCRHLLLIARWCLCHH